MFKYSKIIHNLPINLPMNFSGNLSSKIYLKKDFVRADGTQALYLQVIIDKKIKRIPLHVSAREQDFDKIKQRVNPKAPNAKDTNLTIEKALADVNKIEVHYRLSNQMLTMDRFLNDFGNPTSKLDFIVFWETEMKRQKELLNASTYRQQMTMLNKVREFRSPMYFFEITSDLVEDMKAYFKKVKKNNDNTIASLIKSFKKYLHIANKRGIITPIEFSDIKNRDFRGNRTFLSPEELRKLSKYHDSEFINPTYKTILAQFLFSCFTGLRYSDVHNLGKENIIGNYIAFTAEKTKKFQRIPLNASALRFIDTEKVFEARYTNEYINREIKTICKNCGITKKISFHVARHTFATNFLLSGGRVEVLQKILGHSKITETEIYIHIVDSITDIQIHNMDEILSLNQ